MRAAYIDMTTVNNICPQGLTYTAVNSTRMCTRSHSNAGRTSVNFPTHGVPYTKVCRRALAYQRGSTDAFYNIQQYSQSSLNGYYVDGLSVTHGDPRSHWERETTEGYGYAIHGGKCDNVPLKERVSFNIIRCHVAADFRLAVQNDKWKMSLYIYMCNGKLSDIYTAIFIHMDNSQL